MRKSLEDRKLSVAKAGRKQRPIQIYVDARAEGNIAAAKAKYREILERDVSTSLVVRRALDLLGRYLEGVTHIDWIKDELAAVAKNLR